LISINSINTSKQRTKFCILDLATSNHPSTDYESKSK
jgi:hypothetical protein